MRLLYIVLFWFFYLLLLPTMFFCVCYEIAKKAAKEAVINKLQLLDRNL